MIRTQIYLTESEKTCCGRLGEERGRPTRSCLAPSTSQEECRSDQRDGYHKADEGPAQNPELSAAPASHLRNDFVDDQISLCRADS